MCGFVGILSSNTKINVEKNKIALQTLQHRGQSSAGIASFNTDGTLSLFKKRGLVDVLSTYKKDSDLSIGHLRYPTIGEKTDFDAQPFLTRKPGIILAHNGQIINHKYLRHLLEKQGVCLSSSSDIEPVLFLLSQFLEPYTNLQEKEFFDAFKDLYKLIRGSFSFVGGIKINGETKMFCARDPYGLRPLFWAKTQDGDFVCASETIAFKKLGIDDFYEVPSGTVVLFDKERDPISVKIQEQENKFCAFELVYFSDPETIYQGIQVKDYRKKFGAILAKTIKKKSIEFDFVTAIPETAVPAAKSLAKYLNLEFKEVFIKKTETRTFIIDNDKDQTKAINEKISIIEDKLKDKKVLIVDDSIVRGNTVLSVIKRVNQISELGEIHLAVSSPPVLFPCYYGIDMASKKDFIARKFTKDTSRVNYSSLEKDMANFLRVKTITYLPIQDFKEILGKNKCMACFNEEYPLKLSRDLTEFMEKDSLHRRLVYENDR